jgi:hypothetical protein
MIKRCSLLYCLRDGGGVGVEALLKSCIVRMGVVPAMGWMDIGLIRIFSLRVI